MDAIFVVGTGRSGTHFTVRLLNGFEHARDPLNGKEAPEILADVAQAAIHHRLPSQATAQYYRKHLQEGSGVFLDQHHPNLFSARHWAAMFPGAVFLHPQRPAYQVVASMLRHKGVMSWYKYARNWRQRTINRLPYPNRFLGLDRFGDMRALPPHLLCAHRVIAHRRAFEGLVGDMNGALRGVNYEALISDPLAEFSRVFTADEIATLGHFTLVEKPNPVSLHKYRDVLSEEQVAEIEALELQAFA